MKTGSALLALAASLMVPHAAWADDGAAKGPDDALLNMPLEDLLTVESTSVAKKRQKVSDSAAAVFVITQEDIRRSAASSITDLLRMVPGVEVGNEQTGGTAVSIRGFNSRLANSLLVMIDGRSIYVTTLSGVFWDQQLIPLADIERIEVVRGPGATLWGSNAVNGVINIISKHSSAAQGIFADVRGGPRKQTASLSYSGHVNDDLSYRVYGNIQRDKGLVDAQGNDLSRQWLGEAVGARVDYQPTGADAFTLQAEYSNGRYDSPFNFLNTNLLTPGYTPVQTENFFNGLNVVGRWSHKASDTLDWSLQSYYDRFDREEYGGAIMTRHLGDVDLGLRWKASAVHELNLGVDGRIVKDTVLGIPEVMFVVPSRTDKWISGYVQDDISLLPNRLRLTLGTKLEYNNVTGVEVQPSAKLFYRANPGLAIWGSFSRAARTPSRIERDGDIGLSVDMPFTANNPYPLPIYGRIIGNPKQKSERLIAYELGIRANITQSWSLDIAGYYNAYTRLSSIDFSGVTPIMVAGVPFPVGLTANTVFTNNGKAQTWGVEVALSGHVTDWWKLDLAYSRFDYHLSQDPSLSQTGGLLFPLSGSPRDQLSLRNAFDISDRLSLDSQLKYVSSLPGVNVPAYIKGDLRLTYRPNDTIELSLIGENLLQARQLEFVQNIYPIPQFYTPRSVSAQARVRF